jgi:hypothetical protein
LSEHGAVEGQLMGVFPGRTAALPFHTAVGTIEEDEPPPSSSQTCAVDGVEPKRFNPAVPHRFLPLRAVNGGAKPVLEADDDVAGFVDHRFSAINFGCSWPERAAEANSGSVCDRAIGRIPEAARESRIPFDKNHLTQFRHFVAFAGKSDPFLDMAVGYLRLFFHLS